MLGVVLTFSDVALKEANIPTEALEKITFGNSGGGGQTPIMNRREAKVCDVGGRK